MQCHARSLLGGDDPCEHMLHGATRHEPSAGKRLPEEFMLRTDRAMVDDPAPALRPPPELAVALALGDYERAAAVKCSAAMRVQIVQAEQASGRQDADFGSRAMTHMAIALGKRGNMHDAVVMLTSEASMAKGLPEQLSRQACNASERAVLEQCLVGPEREEMYASSSETVRNELFDLFGIWIGLSLMPACPPDRLSSHLLAFLAIGGCASKLMLRVGIHRIFAARPRTAGERITRTKEKESDGERHACNRGICTGI